LVLLIKRALYPVAILIVGLQVLGATSTLEYATYTTLVVDQYKVSGTFEYNYIRCFVFHIFTGLVFVSSDFVMATMYFASAVSLYTAYWQKKMIMIFVMIVSLFVGFAVYWLVLLLRGLNNQQKSIKALLC